MGRSLLLELTTRLPPPETCGYRKLDTFSGGDTPMHQHILCKPLQGHKLVTATVVPVAY